MFIIFVLIFNKKMSSFYWVLWFCRLRYWSYVLSVWLDPWGSIKHSLPVQLYWCIRFNINMSSQRFGGFLLEYTTSVLLCATSMCHMMGKIKMQMNFGGKTESRCSSKSQTLAQIRGRSPNRNSIKLLLGVTSDTTQIYMMLHSFVILTHL